jgi:membrane protease YdiL (CAAX protease family)
MTLLLFFIALGTLATRNQGPSVRQAFQTLTQSHASGRPQSALRTQPMSYGERNTNPQWALLGKLAVGGTILLAEAGWTSESLQLASRLLDNLPDDPGALRRALVIAGHLKQHDLNLAFRKRLQVLPGDSSSEQFKNRILIRLYGAEPPQLPNAFQLSALREDLGWLSRMVEVDALALTDREAGRQAREALHRDCVRATYGLLAFFACFLAAFLSGVVLLIAYALLLTARRLEMRGTGGQHGQNNPDVAWIGFETFTGYLCWITLVMLAGQALSAWGLGEILGPWFWLATSALAPLVAFWPRIRNTPVGLMGRLAGLCRGQGWVVESLLGLAGYVAAIPLVVIASYGYHILIRVLGIDPESAGHPYVPELLGAASAWEVGVLFLMAVGIAPVVEELFFRGILYGALRQAWGAVPAACGVSLIFALLHPQGLLAIPLLFTLGLVLAALREWRGSLVAPIVAHALVNGVTSFLLLIAR